jgi:HK97 family phage portal protein
LAKQGAFLQSFFNKYVWDTRGLNDPSTPLNSTTIDEVLGGKKSKSGVQVNEEVALTYGAVWRSVALLSGIISSLPIQVFRKTANGRELVSDHPVSKLITRKPNKLMTKAVYFDRSVNHNQLWGNSYAWIQRNGSAVPIALLPVHPSDTEVFQKDFELFYKIKLKTGNSKYMEKIVPSSDILHWPGFGDGVVGKSIIKYMREDIGLGIAARDYGSTVFSDGGLPTGFLTVPNGLKPEQIEANRANWKKYARGNGEGVAVLQGDIKFNQLTIPPDDAQFLETRKFNVEEIARWFGVPPHKIASMEHATFSNIEHQAIEFLQDTIVPMLAKIEGEYTTKLFREDEEDYYVEFNVDGYVRADSQAKAEMLRTNIQNGLMTPNEGRAKQNMNSMNGGDELYIQQNMMPLSVAKEVVMAKSAGKTKTVKE